MNSVFTIKSVLKDPTTNKIMVAEFELRHTDDQFPGTEIMQAGIVPVGTPLPANASNQTIINALIAQGVCQSPENRAFVFEQMAFQHAVNTMTRVQRQPVVATSDMVDAERDRRIDGGFSFKGHMFQSRPTDRENIAGAYSAALTAKIAGAPDELIVWSPSTNGQPFAWIASDNSMVVMSVKDVLEFGQAALAHKQAHIMAARAIKNMETIPADFANDQYWP